MAKEIQDTIKVQIEAGEASPAPPLGPTLADKGVDVSDFCNKFNEQTEDKAGWTIPVVITIYEDGSYDFETKSFLTSELLKKEVGIESGSGEPNRDKVGTISREQLKNVAEKKIEDLNTSDMEQAIKIVKGTALNMGLEVEE